MSQPLLELQRLLAGRQTTTGRVVAVTGEIVRVATAQGVVEIAGTGLALGDLVMVRGGSALKIQSSGGQTVFFV